MLKLKNIHVTIGNKSILKNICCNINQGDFIIIVGGNGAGKTTLFDTIAGKIIPNEGEIFLNNKKITESNEKERSSYISRIFQNTNLNTVGSLSVLENLAISQFSNKKISFDKGISKMPLLKASNLLHTVGLPKSILDMPMNKLSGGQRQLISFIMSTQSNFDLLLLDEPTAALDPQASTKLLYEVTKFIKKNKTTALLITHDPLIAMHIGNKIWILEKGIIIKEYNEEEKKKIINPNNLIGQIDYKLLESIQ